MEFIFNYKEYVWGMRLDLGWLLSVELSRKNPNENVSLISSGGSTEKLKVNQ